MNDTAQAANILVDDDTCCVISDFGQSEMKSEVYRVTRVFYPRTFVSRSSCHLLTFDSIQLRFCCRRYVTLASA